VVVILQSSPASNSDAEKEENLIIEFVNWRWKERKGTKTFPIEIIVNPLNLSYELWHGSPKVSFYQVQKFISAEVTVTNIVNKIW
jgi:hypothetical protein